MKNVAFLALLLLIPTTCFGFTINVLATAGGVTVTNFGTGNSTISF